MARITSSERRSLLKSDFALPGKGKGLGGKGPGAYPIDTANRARNALARVSQHGTSSEKASVRRAVKRKYPSIDKANGKSNGK